MYGVDQPVVEDNFNGIYKYLKKGLYNPEEIGTVDRFRKYR